MDMDAAILQLFDIKTEIFSLIPDFEIKVTPGSYEEVSERFKTYLRFRFGIDPPVYLLQEQQEAVKVLLV